MKPVFKIKKNQNVVPTTLQAGELAVDFGTQKMYTGTATPTAVPVASRVVHDAAFPSANDPHVPTQFATKSYISTNYSTGGGGGGFTPKSVCNVRITTMPSSNLGGVTSTSGLDPANVIISQSSPFLSYGYDSNGFESGFYQTSVRNMYLNVSYSVVYSPIDIGLFNYPGVETTGQYWRMFGINLIRGFNFQTGLTDKYYYGVTQTPPVIGTATTSTNFTMLNGSAIIKLPKFEEVDGNRWMLQFFNSAQSSMSVLNVGNFDASITNINNTPSIADNYKFQIEIVKLFEEV